MLINVCIDCIVDDKTGQSECRILLDSLNSYRNNIKRDRLAIGEVTANQLLYQLDSIIESVQDAALQVLEGLETVTVSNGKGGYKDVYELHKVAENYRPE